MPAMLNTTIVFLSSRFYVALIYQDHKFERGGIKSSNQSYHGLNKGYVTKVFLRLILVVTFQLCL